MHTKKVTGKINYLTSQNEFPLWNKAHKTCTFQYWKKYFPVCAQQHPWVWGAGYFNSWALVNSTLEVSNPKKVQIFIPLVQLYESGVWKNFPTKLEWKLNTKNVSKKVALIELEKNGFQSFLAHSTQDPRKTKIYIHM